MWKKKILHRQTRKNTNKIKDKKMRLEAHEEKEREEPGSMRESV